VSVFRPSARTIAPDGRTWEIYAYRLELPAKRKVRRFPAALVRALRSDVWTIEAVTWGGHRENHRWKTDGEHRRQVLAQVEGSIARGMHPNPRHASYVSRSAR
jgi:hypothetical protein